MKMFKNDNCLRLSSMLNFISRFWNKLSKSLMLPHEHFQNIKQQSKYLFHDQINSVFILWMNFLPIISYRFSSKYARLGWFTMVPLQFLGFGCNFYF